VAKGDNMSKLNWWKRSCAVSLLCAATAVALPAQTFTRLHTFDATDGANPYAQLVQATDGNLYGTTAFGGVSGYGTVFKISASGTLKRLYNFCSQSGCTDGSTPYAGLIQATDGNFYGTTIYGGANSDGTVFKVTPSGELTTLYSFCSQTACSDGGFPETRLIQASEGNLYGTTAYGGAHGYYGTVFKITLGGELTTLYSFCSQSSCTDGSDPSALVQGTDGNFYGTTYNGGANFAPCNDGAGACGTVFKITPAGALTTLHSFCAESGCTDGQGPAAALLQATDGSFYGTTHFGGDSLDGTMFKITSNGALTTLYSFCSGGSCATGAYPTAALVQATDGNFYGAASVGGNGSSSGTIFNITPSGTLTTLYSFCSKSNCMDGAFPGAGLLQDTNGRFYGTTNGGGDLNGDGILFSLSMGLGPFVEAEPSSGKVGKAIGILGTNLTGATSVTFNGTPAVITVATGSLIKTTVPSGATTGRVEVVTPGGTLNSNVPFRVAP
jgi:uncharacterized repeat protein (TIGR03803 family)